MASGKGDWSVYFEDGNADHDDLDVREKKVGGDLQLLTLLKLVVMLSRDGKTS